MSMAGLLCATRGRSRSRWFVSLAPLLSLLLLLFSPSSPSGCLVAATPTGGSADPFNSTLSASTSQDPAAALPIGSGAAVGILCAAVVLVCCCLFVCARSQIGSQKSKHSGAKATGGAGVGTAAAARSARMRAKLEAMRRGWRKSDLDDSAAGALTGVVLTGGARESPQAASLAQSQSIRALSGGSMGGLGACRFSAFTSDDFTDEPWASAEVLESLRVSGNILDVVLTARMSMSLSALSGLVPLMITAALPFHELILQQLELSDWYGPIERVEFTLCIIISGTALAVHLLAYAAARHIFHYDRAPSIQKQTAELRAAARIEEQKRIQAAAAATIAAATAGAASTTAVASPTVTQQGAAVNPRGGSMSAVAQAARNGLFLRQPTLASPAFAFASNVGAVPPTLFSPSASAAAAPIVAVGADPPLWPLTALCVCALGSYLLLGFAGFIAMDESIGRQYGLTSTPRKLWPPSAGRGPFVTFLVCLIVGATAMLPIALSLRLLALFKPRHVHPNLMK